MLDCSCAQSVVPTNTVNMVINISASTLAAALLIQSCVKETSLEQLGYVYDWCDKTRCHIWKIRV